jgi:transposase-like protein
MMLVPASLHGGHEDTSSAIQLPGRRTRRRHSASFKASIVSACIQPGVSLSAAALANGLNPNMVRRWAARADGVDGPSLAGLAAGAALPAASRDGSLAKPGFLPLAMSAAHPQILVEMQRHGTCLKVTWPAEAAAHCATWMRELPG